MLLYGTALIAARRAARRNRDEIVILPGPPLWLLLFEQLAHGTRTRWDRIARFFARTARRLARRSPHRGQTATAATDDSPESVDSLSPARAMVWGTIATSLLVFLLAGSLIWALDGDLVNAVGVGLFSAFWIGLGFGAIAAGVVVAVAQERHRSVGDQTVGGPPTAADHQEDLAA